MNVIAQPLIPHGVAQEMVHLRCHVVPDNKLIFLFTQDAALQALKVAPTKGYDLISASQDGVDGITGVCYGIPFGRELHEWAVPIPDEIWLTIPPPFSYKERHALSTTAKGNKALAVVKMALDNDVLKLERFSTRSGLSIVTDRKSQIEGSDIVVSLTANVRIQVKCDLRAFRYHSLALQLSETNPLKRF